MLLSFLNCIAWSANGGGRLPPEHLWFKLACCLYDNFNDHFDFKNKTKTNKCSFAMAVPDQQTIDRSSWIVCGLVLSIFWFIIVTVQLLFTTVLKNVFAARTHRDCNNIKHVENLSLSSDSHCVHSTAPTIPGVSVAQSFVSLLQSCRQGTLL